MAWRLPVRAALAAGALPLALGACSPAKCGAVLGPGYGDAGIVAFGEVAVGQSETLHIPIDDSVDQDVTFVSGSISGAGADQFQVLSTFPVSVASGTPTTVDVSFAPETGGTFAVSLVLDTASMGDTAIPLSATAEAGDGG